MSIFKRKPNLPDVTPAYEREGEVWLVDVMGDDASIVQAARVSYGAGTKTVSEDSKLIRYLMRNRHTSPFEMVEFKFHIRCPIFVARQWVRHRTANLNEVSGRYSVMPGEFFMFDELAKQSSANKQGRAEPLGQQLEHKNLMRTSVEYAYQVYTKLINEGVSREQARSVLPSNLMTEFYWKIDLHNLLHFLHLRCDSHAQKEIRDLADKIESIVANQCPITWQAWVDYVHEAHTLSRPCWEALRTMLNGLSFPSALVPGLEKDDIAALKELGLNVPNPPSPKGSGIAQAESSQVAEIAYDPNSALLRIPWCDKLD